MALIGVALIFGSIQSVIRRWSFADGVQSLLGLGLLGLVIVRLKSLFQRS